MAGAGRQRLLQLPRRADQQSGAWRVPSPYHTALATRASAPQPESANDMGSDEEARKRLAAQTACPTSLAKPTLRRQTPEVGAVCPNWARTVLCGGRSVMGVPTATKARFAPCPPYRAESWWAHHRPALLRGPMALPTLQLISLKLAPMRRPLRNAPEGPRPPVEKAAREQRSRPNRLVSGNRCTSNVVAHVLSRGGGKGRQSAGADLSHEFKMTAKPNAGGRPYRCGD